MGPNAAVKTDTMLTFGDRWDRWGPRVKGVKMTSNNMRTLGNQARIYKLRQDAKLALGPAGAKQIQRRLKPMNFGQELEKTVGAMPVLSI